ncbi:MAG: helix-turn-helix transcriptional regulator [bacterium]|nr:helix-turn-helix transcriptional regulator [bacterium]
MAVVDSVFKPDEKLIKALRETIKALRTSKKYSQKVLGERSRLHWRYIQRIENESTTPNSSLSVFARIANGLGLSPVKLLREIYKNIT